MRKEFCLECEGMTYAAPQYGKEIRVKVGKDVDEEGVVTLSKEAIEELEIQEGDLVEIYGAWMKEAKAVLSGEKDIALVRMDKALRAALPCAIGQCIGIRKKYEE